MPISNRDIDCLVSFLNIPLNRTDLVFERFMDIPSSHILGEGKSRFLYAPGSRRDRVALVAHVDTLWDSRALAGCEEALNTVDSFEDAQVDLMFEDEYISNPGRILGGDDRAGCAALWLLQDLGHSLILTDGEELGCIGSKYLQQKHTDLHKSIIESHMFFLELDLANGDEFKCYNVGTDPFREYVHKSTGYTESKEPGYTDICEIAGGICGVNMSVGYYCPHSYEEFVNTDEWMNTINRCRRWLGSRGIPRFSLS